MKFDKEVLEKKTCKELATICKENGIKHYSGKKIFNKDLLISSILENDVKFSQIVKHEILCDAKEPLQKEVVEEPILSDDQKKQKEEKYVRNAEIGSLVAFKEESGKVNTAMIIKAHKTKPLFMLETKYGARFLVEHKNILWVKSKNGHWPKGIFLLLKGGEKLGNND